MNEESRQFHIERTQKSLFESGKRVTGAMGLVIFLITLAALITFGGSVETEFTIPLTGLQLPKWHASEVVIVVACASLFRALSLNLFRKRTASHLKTLLKEADWNDSTEFLHYPSMFTSLGHGVEKSRRELIVSVITALAGFLVVFGIPLGLLAYIGFQTSFERTWFIAAALSVVFLVASGMILTVEHDSEGADVAEGED